MSSLPNALRRSKEAWAAAIIEVAARDWWLGKHGEREMRKVEIVAVCDSPSTIIDCGAESKDCTSSWTEDWEWKSLGRGPTPLHAILAATEAR